MNKTSAGRFTETLPESEATWFPLQTSTATMGVLGVKLGKEVILEFGARQSVEAFAFQLGLVLEKEHFVQAITRAELLAQSERLQRTLLDSVSHELKTPLAIIQASLDGLSEFEANPYVREIHTANKRLQRVVNHLLQMTRIESVPVRPEKEWCLALEVVQNAIELVGEELAKHQVNLQVPADLPPVQVDPNLLTQALANILHNAAVYSPEGKAIDVTGSLDPNGMLSLRVEDHGEGIRAGDEEKIFQKFYRSSGSPAGGTGLGLSIARILVRAMGGDIVATSSHGKGAVFTISLHVATMTS